LPQENEASLVETAWPLDALPVDYIRAVFDLPDRPNRRPKAYNFSYGLLAVGSEPGARNG
jgi:ATP-dependent helicase/nuclease subunit A